MTRFFGTDGVRGVADIELTQGMAFALGEMAVTLLGPRLVVGRDTRLSGPSLEAALAAGITSAGGTALLAGIIPTPAVALLTRTQTADGGVVISASHNPPEHNGIKFFDAQGFKLTKELEDEFEARLQSYVNTHDDTTKPPPLATAPQDDGGAFAREATERYIAHAVETVSGQGLDLVGLKIAVDTGYGASCVTTPEALRRLGAEVVTINTTFDGARINVNCGSTHLEPLRALVVESGADVGLAHDGDADRLLALDAGGNEVDGDFIEAIIALDLKARGLLTHDTVVSTVLCNLGFVQAMEGHGISVIQTAVGDSNVLAAMLEGGFSLGGEQSGHMILLEHNSTGDGLVTALQLLSAQRRSGKPLTELSQVMTRFPQVLINIRVKDREALGTSEAIAQAAEAATQRLAGQGRVLLRASGTEALVRVMVEAADEQAAQEEAGLLATLVKQELA
ncbi:MAG: phosphoglucosamine mutase [Coriobacteriia bacterium]|nr:phosphoglucosamine mutase [Coriobacteriia bacterium]